MCESVSVTVLVGLECVLGVCEREMEVAVFLVCSVLAVVSGEVQYQHPEEWQLWKTEHGKSYQSQREELERHLVWLSNREYIDSHNANSDVFGFTLALNHFGDLVSYISNSI